MSKRLSILKHGRTWWLLLLLWGGSPALARELCDACGKVIEGKIYTWDDKIAHAKKRLCDTCTDLPTVCYLCGVPVLKEYQSLADGRTLCNRDGRTVVLDDDQAAQLCAEVKQSLDRQFIRFITFPETNVSVGLMDRVRIQEIYKFAGNDYACPNMWGCTITKTNKDRLEFGISLLSGLPRELLQATCVHEHTHTWIRENLPAARLRQMDKDAIEAFCELVSFLHAEAQGLKSVREHILGNHYTRGQIHLFLEAERRFGFNEIVEWMKSGADARLFTNEVVRVRDLRVPDAASPAARPVSIAAALPARKFEQFVLQGITWSKTRPMAMINGRNFEPGNEVKLPLGETNVLVRCVSISEDAVVIQPDGSPVAQTLRLAER